MVILKVVLMRKARALTVALPWCIIKNITIKFNRNSPQLQLPNPLRMQQACGITSARMGTKDGVGVHAWKVHGDSVDATT